MTINNTQSPISNSLDLKPQNLEPRAKLKICVLGTRGIPDVQGGVETHCEHIYPELVKCGNKVTVYRRLPYVKDDGIFEFKGVSLIDLSCPRKKSFEAIIHTFRGVMHAWHMKPDVLHIHAVGPALLTPLARLLGIRVVITHHGPDYQRAKWGKFAKLILRIGEWFGCRFANEVITISNPIAEHILKATGRRKVTVIPNGVVIPKQVESFDVGKQYGLQKGKYVFALGRFVPEKGFVDLIKAFSWLQGEGCGVKGEDCRVEGEGCGVKGDEDVEGDMSYNPEPIAKNLEPKTLNYKLVIAGDADHEDETSRQIKAFALKTNNVVLTGFIRGQSLCELFSHAGLFVIPSYYEGLPISLLEAMSYGLSCIVSDIPANRNVKLPDERFFKPGDIKGLAEKISVFIDKPLSEEEKKRQVDMISEKYDWAKIAVSTLEVYKKVLVCRVRRLKKR